MFENCKNKDKCCIDNCNEKDCISKCTSVCKRDCEDCNCPKIIFSLEC